MARTAAFAVLLPLLAAGETTEQCLKTECPKILDACSFVPKCKQYVVECMDACKDDGCQTACVESAASHMNKIESVSVVAVSTCGGWSDCFHYAEKAVHQRARTENVAKPAADETTQQCLKNECGTVYGACSLVPKCKQYVVECMDACKDDICQTKCVEDAPSHMNKLEATSVVAVSTCGGFSECFHYGTQAVRSSADLVV